VNWQPISQMPLIRSRIDTSLDDTREPLGTLSKAKDRPHVLDDATIDRVEQVHTGQMTYVDIYTQQISRWRTQKPSASQARELDRMEAQNQQLRGVTANVLTLARELRKGTIECVLGMSDLELGLQYLLGRRSRRHRKLQCGLATVVFVLPTRPDPMDASAVRIALECRCRSC
jgi:hypothetical protein